MGIEIERKFLLKNSGWRNSTQKKIKIKQGYLNSNIDRTVRVRINGTIGQITVKGKTLNMTRKEYEYEIPIAEAIELLNLCEQPIIVKTRIEITHNNRTWEIDEFEGINKGLIVAEIELKSENETIEFPEWIGKEVTLDPKYYNSSLINNPYSKW